MCENPNAVDLLRQHPENINYRFLSSNRNALDILEQNLDKIDMTDLSENPAAIHLIRQNLNRINMRYLSKNPAIFELDLDAMKLRIKPLAEELARVCFHPVRVLRFLDKYNYNIVNLEVDDVFT